MAKVLERSLYQTDYYAWTRQQAAALRKLAATLDLENLAEEVESLGRSDLNTVRSRVRRIIEHLLKLEYSPSVPPRPDWRYSVAQSRRAGDHHRRGAARVVLQSRRQLDFRRFADGYVATAADVEAELGRIGHVLEPLDIVVVNTAVGAAYGRPDYVAKGCGMGREATLYLLERGVRVTGTHGWSWDAPFAYTKERYARTRDASLIWEGHRAGMEIGYCHLENLHNLEALPATGFLVCCFPFKIRGASAGFTRAVAIIED